MVPGEHDGDSVPCRCADSTATRPPCAATIPDTIESPRPAPWIALAWAVEERKNFWNRPACSSSGMPMPVSATAQPGLAVAGSSRTAISPPSAVNLTALLSRLSITRSSCIRSPSTTIARCGTCEVEVEVRGRSRSGREGRLGVLHQRPEVDVSRSISGRRTRARPIMSRSLQIVISRSPLRAMVSRSGSWARVGL